jgi:hypothetical protein
MTLDKAHELLAAQIQFGGGYQRNGARLIIADVQREHGLDAADRLIREFDLESLFGFKPGESL